MAPNPDIEQSFNPFSVNEELQNNELDTNVILYLGQIFSLGTKY